MKISVIRTAVALDHHLESSDDIVSFENTYRYMNREDWKSVIRALQANKLVSITLSQCKCVLDNTFVNAIARSTAIKILALPLNALSDEKQIDLLSDIISQNTSIRRMDLRCTGLQDHDFATLLKALKRNVSLETIQLSGNFLSEDVLSMVDELRTIQPNINIEGLDNQRDLPSIPQHSSINY